MPPSRRENNVRNQAAGRRRRRIVFPLLAVLVGFSPLLVCEAVLRIAGIGVSRESEDPYIGFTAIRPLFALNEANGRYEMAKSRQDYFRPDSFSANKPANEFRIFCLGGSTVQGRPFAIETSFTTWLELSLRAAEPARKWEVVNCGGVSYASYRLIPIIQECLQYEPDLFILYTGQNEFLEARTYEHVKQAPALLATMHAWLGNVRTYNAARSAWMNLAGDSARHDQQRSQLPEEVDARLDYQHGLDEYHRDDSWRNAVVEHYRFNLDRMLRLAAGSGVPVVLVNPCSNLRSCAPFKSQQRAGLDEVDRQRFRDLIEQSEAVGSNNVALAVEMLAQAREIDDRHALLHFRLGQYYDHSFRFADAKTAFLHAKDEDVCPLRMLESMHEVVFQVAQRHDVALVDVRAFFESESPGGIPGENLFLDHVHPTIDGHKKIANLIFAQLVSDNVVTPQSDWELRKKQLYSENLDRLIELNPVYYERGRQRLEGLRRWTKGEVGPKGDW